MNKIVSFALLLLFIAPLNSGAEEIIKKGELVTLDRAIEIAIKKHPNVSAAQGNVSASASRVREAESAYYPQVNASAGYSRVSPISSDRLITDSTTGLSTTGSSGSFNQYTGSITLSQNIYDFGKTGSQVGIQKYNLDSSRSDLETAMELVIFNVKQAYYGTLQAKRTRDVADDTVKQFQQHLEQAKGFFEVGTKPKFDVTKAEVDLSNSRLSLIKAENSLKVSRVTLNNALGVPDAPDYLVEDNLAFQKYEITFEKAIETAYKNRPDLQSAVSKRMSAEKAVEFARTGYYPAVTGNAAYNRAGSTFLPGSGWSIGAALSFPIFNGFLTKSQVEEATANLSVARANEDTIRLGIMLDVQQAYLNLAVAEDSIKNTELTVKQATENLEIANGRYSAGVGNPIEVTDAEVLLTNAKTANIQSLYDYKIARASLEKAMGIR